MQLLHAGPHESLLPFHGAESLLAIVLLGVLFAALVIRTDNSLHRVLIGGYDRLRRVLPGQRHGREVD
jgi:hypothetical protein